MRSSAERLASFLTDPYNAPVILVGIDPGNRRVGIAVSESGVLATPHSILEHDGDLDSLARRITEIAVELGAERMILGLPRRTGGNAAAKFDRFAASLERESGIEVVLWDEAYSTTEARALRRERGGKKGRTPIDHEAAAVILQSYLDAMARRSS